MEPSEYLAVLRRRWLTLLVSTLLGLGASVLLMIITAPVYQTSAKVFLSTKEGNSVGELVQGSTYAQNLVQSYADLATTPVVLEPVISDLGLNTTPEALAGNVRADVTLNTVIIEISASAPNGATAAAIANTVGKELAVAVQNVSPKGLKSGEAIQISPISPAKVPTVPSWPNRKLLGALGLAFGLALGVGLALLRDVWGTRIRNEEGLARASSAPLLGTVAVSRKDGVLAFGAHGAKADAFRRLEESLSFYITREQPFSFALLTSKATVGATLTSVDLAVTLAEAGRRVVLVDGDLGRPSIAEHMGLRYQRGLSRLIADRTPVEDALKDWDDGAVRVLPGGPVPPNPDELLAAPAMGATLERLRELSDVVLVHAQATSAAALALRVDGFVLLVEPRTRKREVTALVANVERAGGRVLGLVLVRVSGPRNLPVERAASAPAAPWWRTGRQAAHGRSTGKDRTSDAELAGTVLEPVPTVAAPPAPAPSPPAPSAPSAAAPSTPTSSAPAPSVPPPFVPPPFVPPPSVPPPSVPPPSGAPRPQPAVQAQAVVEAQRERPVAPPAVTSAAPTAPIAMDTATDSGTDQAAEAPASAPAAPSDAEAPEAEAGAGAPTPPSASGPAGAAGAAGAPVPAPATAADIRWEPPNLFFSERWAPPTSAAPLVDMFQARVPPVPLAPPVPANDGPSNGTSDDAADSGSDESADDSRDKQATPADDERTSRPEPDVSRR
jgi:polysaccharide biosynthesis transport protein